MNKIIEQFESEQITRELPEFSPGDTVVVNVKVTEGTRERVQAFEGVCIARRGVGVSATFTVRKISARYAAPSCTTCAVWKARRHASRKTLLLLLLPRSRPKRRPKRRLPLQRSKALHQLVATRVRDFVRWARVVVSGRLRA